jgi:transcriptional regulator with XRE-family HTH domain
MHSLKLARVRAGMTLTELAEKSGVTPNTISQIERGGWVPQATTLYKLALALRVDAAVLVEREKATA